MLSVLVMARTGVVTVPFGHRSELVLGRSLDSDVTIADERASRIHAKLVVDEGRVWVVDLGSSNGTRLGAQRLTPRAPARLDADDMLVIGATAVVVHSTSSPAGATADEIERARAILRARIDAGDIDSESRIELDAIARPPGWDDPRQGGATLLDCGVMARFAPVIERIAASPISVLLLGETGVGKEVLARTLHARSPRARAPMLCVSCAALSEPLLESELFGHERGAFTGAAYTKPGLLESAEGGTVFLDEVSELPLATQAKLLRVLEVREVRRVGGLRPIPIDVRFIAATHRDLLGDAGEGRFRADLYFRLNGVSLTLPPLRERADEIEPLARWFVEQACRDARRLQAPAFSPEAMSILTAYGWPGNVRELRNVVERAVLLCSGGAITPADLVWDAARVVAPPRRPREIDREPPPTRRLPERASDRAERAAKAIDADERDRVIDALRRCAGNQTQAAKLLGVTRRQLIARIERLKLRRPRKDVA